MKSRILKKLNSKSAFSVSELLVATIILLLAAGGLTVGISLAARHYDEQRINAESKVLFSTLQDTINYELKYTGTVEYSSKSGNTYNIKDFYSITYHIAESFSSFSSLNGDGEEVLDGGGYLALGTAGSRPYTGKKIIGNGSYTFGMGARVDNLTYTADGSQGYFTYVLTVFDKKNEVLITDTIDVISSNILTDNGDSALTAK